MGFFDSFKSGAKDVFKGYDKVKLKEKITYDELYEIMKDETYSVGFCLHSHFFIELFC